MGGFPKDIRKRVFARDKATCQRCGKTWEEGWMLHVIHVVEDIHTIDNALLTCIECHIEDHTAKWAKARTNKERARHQYAIRLLEQLDKKHW